MSEGHCFLCGCYIHNEDKIETLSDKRIVHRMCFIVNFQYLKLKKWVSFDKSKQTVLK